MRRKYAPLGRFSLSFENNIQEFEIRIDADYAAARMSGESPREPFRYAQFCAVARAAEILGHRWNLLILRELFLGPMRFRDLRDRLRDVSSSVLAERLRELEARGVIRHRELPVPASVDVYELTEDGRAFWPALAEIARWGVRFLVRSGFREGDHTDPDWLRGATTMFARTTPTPPQRFEFRVRDGRREVVVRIAGGPGGTRLVGEDAGEPDARITGTLTECLGVISGLVDPVAPPEGSTLRCEGDPAAARAIAQHFEMDFGNPTAAPAPPH
jgi:DNA-binding HxlR family transcriptional regulator